MRRVQLPQLKADSAMNNCFHVRKYDTKTLRFQEASRRLYYFDTVNTDEEGTMLINTFNNNKIRPSALDLTQAKRVIALLRRTGRPISCDYLH